MRKSLERRKYLFNTIFIAVGLIFVVKLFLLQIVIKEYKLSAENNVFRYVTQYPPRGVIYDRNGKLMVVNEAAYDLMVIPRQVPPIDTSEMCQLLSIDKEEFRERLKKARELSVYKPSIFIEQISQQDYAYFAEKLFKFPGFYMESRTVRKYPKPSAANILGYIGEVDKKDIEKDPYYKQGDYIGESGIEKAYEKDIRGKKGIRIKLVDVYNREMGSYKDGRYDTAAIPGKNIYVTLDADLQEYAERLMWHKSGSIVAIEPSTGEILVMVSSPSYDPNLLIGRMRSKNYRKIQEDTLKPMFNRSLSAQYPPGSSFKTVNTVIALSEGVLNVDTKYGCRGTASTPIACSHSHPAPLSLLHAIEQSCNPYFWQVFKSILEQRKFRTIQDAYTYWYDILTSFGIGRVLEGDVPDQQNGNLPKDSYFNKYYGMNGWRPLTIRSLAVGQGEIEETPLQLANLVSIFANRGYYYPPHLMKRIEGDSASAEKFNQKIYTKVDAVYFRPLVEGMGLVFQGDHGTARYYRLDSIQACGKTGTAQNPQGENHSIFIAFAPKDDPKIAISVVVENAGYGATWAAPIASLIMEKYLTGKVRPDLWYEQKMLTTYSTVEKGGGD